MREDGLNIQSRATPTLYEKRTSGALLFYRYVRDDCALSAVVIHDATQSLATASAAGTDSAALLSVVIAAPIISFTPSPVVAGSDSAALSGCVIKTVVIDGHSYTASGSDSAALSAVVLTVVLKDVNPIFIPEAADTCALKSVIIA